MGGGPAYAVKRKGIPMKGWIVAVSDNGFGWYYLDIDGNPFAENRDQAHVWPTRQDALMQAEKWKRRVRSTHPK